MYTSYEVVVGNGGKLVPQDKVRHEQTVVLWFVVIREGA